MSDKLYPLDTPGVYNPFSLLNAFARKKFGSYWFETGTPTYLVNLLKKHHYDLERIVHEGFTKLLLPFYAACSR